MEQREEEAVIGKAHQGASASIALLSTYKSPRFTVSTIHSSSKAEKLKIAIIRKKNDKSLDELGFRNQRIETIYQQNDSLLPKTLMSP